jgi:hypothetical protein
MRIGSGIEQGMDSIPRVRHASRHEAEAEARRLAAKHPTHPRGFAVCEAVCVIKGGTPPRESNETAVPVYRIGGGHSVE